MRGRDDLPRFLAPAAFLAVVTIAVLLIRAGLHHRGDSTTTTTTTPVVRTHTTAPTVTTRAATTATAPAGSTYTIQSGDTYAAIAAHFGTTVQQLEQLNPGVNPNALRVGQQIRVK